MNTCHVFCAGGFAGLLIPPENGDLIIAADGGLAHLGELSIQPDVVLGDFDSLGYVPQNAHIFPVEKDDTDAMLALRYGLERGYRRFLLYGSLDGPRLDHTVANLQSLLFLAKHNATGALIGLTQTATVVKNGSLSFPASAKGVISLFSMGKEASGVTLKGLQYPLQDAVLTPDFPLGVSNHFIGEPATVTVTDGCLIVIYDRENGLYT